MREPVAKDRSVVNLDEFERRLRQSSQPKAAAPEDPLTELARLVGDDKDPYQQMFQEHGDAGDPRARDRGQRNFRDNSNGGAPAAPRGSRPDMRQEPRQEQPRPQIRPEARPDLRREPRMPQARPQDSWPAQKPQAARPEPQLQRDDGRAAPRPQAGRSEPHIRRDENWPAQRPQLPRSEQHMRLTPPTPAVPERPLRTPQRPTPPLPSVRTQVPAPVRPQTPARPAAANPAVARQSMQQRPAASSQRDQDLGGNFAAIEAGLRGSIAPSYRPAPKPQPYVADYQDDDYDAQDYEPQTGYRGQSDYRQQNDYRTQNDYRQQNAYHPQYDDDYVDEDEDWLGAAPAPAPRARASSPVHEPLRSRRLVYLTAAVVLVGMGGISVVFASKHYAASPQQIAMIRAASSPAKVQAHAASDPNSAMRDDSVFDKTPQPAPNGVVSHQEQPVNLAQINTGQQASDNNASSVPVPTPPSEAPPWQTDPNAQQPQPVAQQQAAPQPQPANANNPAGAQVADATNSQAFALGGAIQSRKVKTLAVRPDGSVVADNGNASGGNAPAAMQMPDIAQGNGAAPQPQDQAADGDQPAQKATTRAAAANPNAVDDQSANTDNGDGGVAATDAAPKPKAHRPVRTAELENNGDADGASHSGAFAVQLGAPGSEAEAHHLMDKIAEQYQAELGGHQVKFHHVKVGDKSVYRVRVGDLSKSEAVKLCEALQAKGGSCFVAKD